VMPLPSGVKYNKSTELWTVAQSDAWTQEQWEIAWSLMNGLLLPGGDPWPQVASLRLQWLLKQAEASSAMGGYFPIFGTCAGFETLMVLRGGKSCQANNTKGLDVDYAKCFGPLTDGWNSTNVSLPQKLSSSAASSRLLGSAAPGLLQAIEEQPIASNFHRRSVAISTFEANPDLSNTFRSLATSSDAVGRQFVSIVEGIDLPWYAAQFHPEKPAGEWGVKNSAPHENINHGPEAIRLGQHMANFLVSEASRNAHGREASTLKDVTPLLIINDVPRAYIPTEPLFMQTYSFNWTARASPVPRPDIVAV